MLLAEKERVPLAFFHLDEIFLSAVEFMIRHTIK